MNLESDERECLALTRDFVLRGWTQGQPARTATGMSVRPSDPKATCWCLVGAVSHAADTLPGDPDSAWRTDLKVRVYRHLKIATGRGEGPSLGSYNDDPTRTKEEILALINGLIGPTEYKVYHGICSTSRFDHLDEAITIARAYCNKQSPSTSVTDTSTGRTMASFSWDNLLHQVRRTDAG